MGFWKTLRFWASAIKDIILLLLYTIFVYLGIFFRLCFPLKPKSLKGEVILITGSANGIGRLICLQLADAGAKLVCWDISKRENIALVDELKSMGAEATGFDLDVSDLLQVEQTAKLVNEQVGEVTMIINNAAIMPCHQFLSHNPREITRAFNVNVYGPMWIIREFLPQMIKRKKGHIVTMCAAGGLLGSRNLVAYCGSKYAVNGVIESLRDEMRVHPDTPQIQFTTVYPCPSNTTYSKNIIHSRFPWIIPKMTEPAYVALKTVEGIRKNQDYVFIPPVLNFISRIIKALPSKIFWAITNVMGVYAEPREPRDYTKLVGPRQTTNRR